MTEQDLNDFLEANKAEISANIKRTIIEKMTNSMQYQLSSAATDAINAFINEEVVPEVRKHLMENKGPIIQSVISATAVIGDELQKKMVGKATEALSGYDAGNIIKSLFGVR
jgi:hypothetical protein